MGYIYRNNIFAQLPERMIWNLVENRPRETACRFSRANQPCEFKQDILMSRGLLSLPTAQPSWFTDQPQPLTRPTPPFPQTTHCVPHKQGQSDPQPATKMNAESSYQSCLATNEDPRLRAEMSEPQAETAAG